MPAIERVLRSGQDADTEPRLTMAEALDERTVKALAAPPTGNRISYDSEVKGFGVRITSAGARAFILNYRANDRERRITIGSYPDWSVKAAREQAKTLKRQIDTGGDPMAERHADRTAPTVDKLADRFEAEHLPKRRPATVKDYSGIIRLYIRPILGHARVDEVRHVDVERLHATVAKKAPYRANRAVAVLSKMLNLAVKWEWRADNPARGIERAPEHKRERFLTPAEIARLSEALTGLKEQASANAIRMLLLTGARKSEVLKANWAEFDLDTGVWLKAAANVKTKKAHRVPLSAPACLLLSGMREVAEKARKPGQDLGLLFPGSNGKALSDIRESWTAACCAAGLGAYEDGKDRKGKSVKVWRENVRIHDLRHTYASILASQGLSLPIIGQLLGHTQAQTTARYAHLLDDPLREATEKVGRIVSGGAP